MNRRVERRLFVVWLALSLITALQLWLSSNQSAGSLEPNGVITFCVVTMALVKVRFIVQEFMEVRHAPGLLRRLTDTWLVITAVALLGTYFIGGAL
jgi:hypothetical protein